MSEDSTPTSGPRTIPGNSSPKPFRNIQLTPELVAIRISELQVQEENLLIRGPNIDPEQRGPMIITQYDPKNLGKTVKHAESKMASMVGKPGGLPENFDPEACATYIGIALLDDLKEQVRQAEERQKQGEKYTKSVLDEIKALKEENPDISLEDWREKLVEKYDHLKDIVSKKLPNVWSGLEFGLSNLRILNIADCTLPMIGVLLGRPGSGKTVPIMMLSKWIYTYYTDSWTPKAWVTHTTSDTAGELSFIDLLAKIKDHQFLIPEMVTLFGLKEDELRIALSIITRIADGHGYFSDSGAHGRRGYADVMFVLLGAVVDIPNHAYKVMSSLGPRLYFLRLPYTDVSSKNLFDYLIAKEGFNLKYKAIEEALFDYLKWFEIGPTLKARTPLSPHLRQIEWDDNKNDSNAIRCIANLAYLLGYLRREGRAYNPSDKIVVIDSAGDEKEQKYNYFTGDVEDIKRAGQVLVNQAKGHALLVGRNYITMDDVKIITKTVLSTARIERVKAFIALLDSGRDWITREELAESLNISPSTAYRIMIELHAIEVVTTEMTNDIIYTKNNNPANVRIMTLRDNFEWFLSKEFKQLRDKFTPVDNRKFIRDPDPDAADAKAAEAEAQADPEEEMSKEEEKKELRKRYAESQRKIEADAAKEKRARSKEKNKSASGNNNARSAKKK